MKYTQEYLEAKKAKYKAYQHLYYLKVTKKKRKSKKSTQYDALLKAVLKEKQASDNYLQSKIK